MRRTSLVLAALLAVAGVCVMLWPVFMGHRLQAGIWPTARRIMRGNEW